MLEFPPDTGTDRTQNPGPLPVPDVGASPLKKVSDLTPDPLVRHLQKMLFETGYLLGSRWKFVDGVDGIFGLDTDAAVRKFQEDHADWEGRKLVVDGVVGEKTADALNREMVGIWYGTYVSKDKDGTNVPVAPKRPLITHDVDQQLTIAEEDAKLAPMVVLHGFGDPSNMRPDRCVNYIPNDPEAAGSPPPTDDLPRHLVKEAHLLHLHSKTSLPKISIRDTPSQRAKPTRSTSPVFPEPGRFPADVDFPAGTGDFSFQRGQVHVCMQRTLRVWRNLGLEFGAWSGNSTNPLVVTIQSREASVFVDPKKKRPTRPSLNAFYRPPNELHLGFNLVTPIAAPNPIQPGPTLQPGETVNPPFTADSPDVVSHETGHAILDAVAPQLIDSLLTTVGAFHEAFGDITAILTTITDGDVREEFLKDSDFTDSSLVSRLAEEFGDFLFQKGSSPGNPAKRPEKDCLRNAFKDNPEDNPNPPPDHFPFNYRNPDNLPDPRQPGFSYGPGQDFTNTVTQEIHDFGRIFVMAFFDCLKNAFDRLSSGGDIDQKDEALREAAAGIGKILGKAILRAPTPAAGYYRVISRQMFLVDRDTFKGEFAADLIGTEKGNGLVGKDLISKDDPVIGAYLTAKISEIGVDM